MDQIAPLIGEQAGRLLFGFAVAFVIFVPFERLFALKRDQRIFREGFGTDVLHAVVTTGITRATTAGTLLAVLVAIDRTALAADLQHSVRALPGPVQFAIGLLLIDFCGYWYHRAAHEVPFLWRFHSVHHSSQRLDWLATTRHHFVDVTLKRAAKFAPVFLIGITPEMFGALVVVGPVVALWVHSNFRYSFGPLRWLHMTPEYHHWHHALQPVNRNYADQFPVWDVLFGTAHSPKGRGMRGAWPAGYGIHTPMARDWWGQIVHPFRPSSTGRSTDGSVRRPATDMLAAGE